MENSESAAAIPAAIQPATGTDANALPTPLKAPAPVVDAAVAPRPAVLPDSESALPEADAAAFEKRMFDWLLERADLPYLDAADQRCVIHSLLVLLMRSMRKRKSAVGALSDLETHHLVLDVFVKSTIDIFNNPAQRRQLAERIEAYVSAIPFFPTPVLAHVIDFFCGHASAVITPVLVETYNEHLRHSDAYAEMALRSAGEVAADAKPFEARLRANLVRALAKETGRSKVAALGMNFIPEPHFFIDPFLESINTEKLEDVMRSLVLDDALQRELVHRPLRVPDEADGRAMADFMSNVLDRNEDFTAFFDLRNMKVGLKVGLRSKACFSYGVEFMAQERHASRLDARVKGVCLLVKSPVLRTTARWLVALCDPPALFI